MHIELISYGSPIKHKKFIEEVNNWEYPIEGNIRKGVCRPFVCEVKLYDVRIKEEVAPYFLRDMEAMAFRMPDNIHKGLRKKVIDILIKLLKKALGHVEIKNADGPRKYRLPDWFYSFNILNLRDPVQTDSVTGERKEVL